MKHRTRIMIILLLIASMVALTTSCDLLFGTKYLLTFDANSGTGTMDPITLKTDQVTTLPPNTFTKTGYTFSGWATSSTGTATYTDQDSLTMGASDITLYALWSIAFAGGDGSMTTPYQIASASQLNAIRDHLDKYFELTDDIDLSSYASGAGWEPIGTETEPFTGTLYGEEYTISNLFINRPSSDRVGMFGNTSQATIKELTLDGIDVTGKDFTGGLVGCAKRTVIDQIEVQGSVSGNSSVGLLFGITDMVDDVGTTISSCRTQGTVDGTDSYVGGMGGWLNNGSSISESCSSAVVSGDDSNVGGLIGYIQSSKVSCCYATGAVTGANDSIGGLAGDLFGADASYHYIGWSYATGSVTGTNKVGGLLGGKSYNPAVKECYAVGAVSGTTAVGGLIGGVVASPSTVTKSYYDTETTGQSDTGKGTGKTTTAMKQQSTFVDWGFQVNPMSVFYTWEINEGVTYPTLHWQSR